jgi:hypothetical protein
MSNYGTGGLPVIDAGSNTSAVELEDQSFWQISNISTTGGNPYGIHVTANTSGAVVQGIQLHNVTVANVSGTPTDKSTGLIAFVMNGNNANFQDILIDGATVYNTTQWAGISVWGGSGSARGSNITVQNSTAHDVGGDGIVVHVANIALITNSVAYNTGQTTITSIGTPVGIWNWDCTGCTVQSNESYNNHSPIPSTDGGDFDSDYYNLNETIQYNYGHDSDGYCIGIFAGAPGITNQNSVIRYNICSNNGRNRAASDQGEIFLSTWNGGQIDNAKVYNNTIFHNPADPTAPAILDIASYTTSHPDLLVNNIVYSVSPLMFKTGAGQGGLTTNYNLYWYTGGGSPTWSVGGAIHTGLSARQSGSGQDLNSIDADPRLNSPTYHDVGATTQFTLQSGSPAIGTGTNAGSMGAQDFFGNPLSANGPYNIGAFQ